LKDAGSLSDEEVLWLHKSARSDPVELALVTCGGYSIETSIARRLQKFHRITKAFQQSGLGIEASVLWPHYTPLADLLISRCGSNRTCLIGIAGPPGVGKTSLTAPLGILVTVLSERPAAVVSLDDFYLTPSERQSLGHKWRAVPGTHDLNLLAAFLQDVRSEQSEIATPRYNTRVEERLGAIVIARPRFILFEGWFVGAHVPGYESLSTSVDYLIYLDMDLELAHQSRLDREARIRAETNNTMGMTESETEAFWREALLPGVKEWVVPLKGRADLMITVDESHRFSSVSCRDPQASISPSDS
jgi:pantothenate kinase-related protein Tda10